MNFKKLFLVVSLVSLSSVNSWAQFDNETYEDYGAFATDPVELDKEVRDLMGRYFQMNFHLGTGIYTGGLGKAHSAGFLAGLRFILYFDRVWGVELSGGYGKNTAVYNESSTNQENIDFKQSTTLIPMSLGLRYGFDAKNLPRGLSMMNPYITVGPEIFFRTESIKDVTDTTGLDTSRRSKTTEGAVNSSTGWAVFLGAGMEFDVYKEQVFLGVDTRYHIAYWSDGSDTIGDTGRAGHFVTLLLHATYNY